MNQCTQIIKTIKTALKIQGLLYCDVAKYLKLSESNVKRMFNIGDISLARVEKICELMHMDIKDLMELMENQREKIEQLSIQQEQKIVSDIKLLLLTVCVLTGCTFKDIYDTYDYEKPELIKLLLELDKIKLISLKPDNRIKLLISPSFGWQKNGPIQKYFEFYIQDGFFNSSFTKHGELRLVINSVLSDESNTEIQNKMKQLAEEYSELNLKDQKLPINDRAGTTMVMAIRPWRLQQFAELRRDGCLQPTI